MPIFYAWPQCEPQHTHIHTVVLRYQLQQMTELLLCEYVCEVYTLSSSLPHLQQSIRHFPRGGGVALAQLHRPPFPPPPPFTLSHLQQSVRHLPGSSGVTLAQLHRH